MNWIQTISRKFYYFIWKHKAIKEFSTLKYRYMTEVRIGFGSVPPSKYNEEKESKAILYPAQGNREYPIILLDLLAHTDCQDVVSSVRHEYRHAMQHKYWPAELFPLWAKIRGEEDYFLYYYSQDYEKKSVKSKNRSSMIK